MTEDTLKNVHSSADPLLPTTVTLNPGREYFTESRQFQGIPDIEITPGGRLWATWYSGGVNEGPENFVVLVRTRVWVAHARDSSSAACSPGSCCW